MRIRLFGSSALRLFGKNGPAQMGAGNEGYLAGCSPLYLPFAANDHVIGLRR
jgi:hypothetical protein